MHQAPVNGIGRSLRVIGKAGFNRKRSSAARALAACMSLDFARIQFTPDLLPGDVTGVTVWSQEKKEFLYKQGTIMHQFILADEINRASPQTQSSLLGAMQEGSVSADGRTYPLPQPFFVIATENTSEFVGTFPLPEGELDRFGLSISIGYPRKEQERDILNRFRITEPFNDLKPVISPEHIIEIRSTVRKIYLSQSIQDYIIDITRETRASKYIRLGASPRATQHLQLAAQGIALLRNREYVIPDDVRSVLKPVLSHRLILSPEAQMEKRTTGEVISEIVERIPLPLGIKL